MEVGQHCIGPLKLKSGLNEQIGLAAPIQEQALYRAHARGSGAYRTLRPSNLRSALFRNLKSFGVQLLSPHWLKCSETDVQCDVRNLRPGRAARIQNFAGEV